MIPVPWRNLRRTITRAFLEPSYALNAGTRRLKGWLSYRNNDGAAPYPESITIFLTRRCNLRCTMCGQWGEHGSFKGQDAGLIRSELTLDEMRAFLDDAETFRPNITLFGGEPFLYRDIDPLIREIKKRGLHLLIITNGSLIEQHAGLVVEAGVDELSVSIDGPAVTNDAIRGMKGLTERVCRGIALIRELQKKRRAKRPVINVVTTLSEHSIDKLDDMTRTAKELAVDTLNLHHLIWIGRDVNEAHQAKTLERLGMHSPDWEGFVIAPPGGQAVAELRRKAREIAARPRGIPVYFYPNLTGEEIEQYYAASRFTPRTFPHRCLHPWMASYLYPDGSVWPCHTLGYAVGNIRETKFTELWNGAKYRAYRKLMKKELWPVCTKCTEFYRY